LEGDVEEFDVRGRERRRVDEGGVAPAVGGQADDVGGGAVAGGDDAAVGLDRQRVGAVVAVPEVDDEAAAVAEGGVQFAAEKATGFEALGGCRGFCCGAG
jgi:hypothetical protein